MQMNKLENSFGGNYLGEENIVCWVFLLTFWGCSDGGTSELYLPQGSRLVSGCWKRVKGKVHMQVCSLLQGSDSENSYLKQSPPKVKGGENVKDKSVDSSVKCSKIHTVNRSHVDATGKVTNEQQENHVVYAMRTKVKLSLDWEEREAKCRFHPYKKLLL